MSRTKSEILKDLNQYKGLYSYFYIENKKSGKVKSTPVKFISAREYKKCPNSISLSVLVKNNENKYHMTRGFVNLDLYNLFFGTKDLIKEIKV